MADKPSRKTKSQVQERPQSQKLGIRPKMTEVNLVNRVAHLLEGSQTTQHSNAKSLHMRGLGNDFDDGNSLEDDDDEFAIKKQTPELSENKYSYADEGEAVETMHSQSTRNSKHKRAGAYNSPVQLLQGQATLQRAKNLIKQKSDVLQNAQQKFEIVQRQQREETFVTGVGMYQEKVEVPPEGEDDDDSSNEEKMDLNEEEYVKNLIKEFKPENDSLEELRRMIRETKKEIEDYADDLYTLKSSVSEANLGFREIGKGVNEGVFWELDCRFQQDMPNFDKNRIFNNKQPANQLPKLPERRLQPQERRKSATPAVYAAMQSSGAQGSITQHQPPLSQSTRIKKPSEPISSKLKDKNFLDARDRMGI